MNGLTPHDVLGIVAFVGIGLILATALVVNLARDRSDWIENALVVAFFSGVLLAVSGIGSCAVIDHRADKAQQQKGR